MRNQINYGKAVADNGLQFFVKSGLNDFRQRIAIKLMCLVHRQIANIVFCPRHFRRIQLILDGRDFVTHCRDLVRIIDNDLFSQFRSEKGKLVKHLIRRSEVCIRKIFQAIERVCAALGMNQNLAVNRIFFVHEMHVSACNDRLVEFFSQFHHIFDDVFKLFFILDEFALQKRCIQRLWLNLQIIIIFGLGFGRFIAFLHHGRENFAVGTAGTDQKSFTVFFKH